MLTNIKHLFILLSLILCIQNSTISLFSNCATTATSWDCWNQAVGKSFRSLSPFTIPAVPALPTIAFYRTKITATAPLSTNYIRPSQFAYNGTNNQECRVFCGVASYLNLDVSGKLSCVRDNYYWSQAAAKSGRTYTSLCVPNFGATFSLNCNSNFQSLPSIFSGNSGLCDQSLIQGTAYGGPAYSCCYDNSLSVNKPDQLKFNVNTAYTNLYRTQMSM